MIANTEHRKFQNLRVFSAQPVQLSQKKSGLRQNEKKKDNRCSSCIYPAVYGGKVNRMKILIFNKRLRLTMGVSNFIFTELFFYCCCC